MYNSKKVCSCGWSRTYDSNRDTFGVGNYKRCPVCGKELRNEGHSPDI